MTDTTTQPEPTPAARPATATHDPGRTALSTWRLAVGGLDEAAADEEPFPNLTDPGDPLPGAEPDPAMPGISIIDRAAIDAAVRASGYDGDFEVLSGAEEQRVRLLVRYRQDRSLHKAHLIATAAMIERLDDLGREQPNFGAVTAVIRQALGLSLATGHPLRVPPLLLLGRPGTGKTRYVRSLAAALATTIEAVDGASIPDIGSVVGYPPVWRASGPGYVARTLVRAPTSAPLIVVDEIEKIVDFDHNPHPENKLLALLERHTAAVWQDEFLRVPMRAENILWLFTANTTTKLSAPFLDRVVTVRIPAIPRAARDGVLEAMLAEVASECGVVLTLEHRDALGPVRSLGLRRARLAFGLAVARVVAAGRHVMLRADLAQAAGQLRQRATTPPLGTGGPRLRAPLGFIDPRARRRAHREAAGPSRASGLAC